jgi:DNA transformation protein
MASDFLDYITEMLAPLGTVRGKRMFGGVGVYINELFCALIVDDCLYFKGDDDNEAEFKAAGCPPFTYEKDGTVYAMRYYRMPEEAMDDAQLMILWARLGLAAALRKGAAPKPKAKTKSAAKKTAVKPKARPARLG